MKINATQPWMSTSDYPSLETSSEFRSYHVWPSYAHYTPPPSTSSPSSSPFQYYHITMAAMTAAILLVVSAYCVFKVGKSIYQGCCQTRHRPQTPFIEISTPSNVTNAQTQLQAPSGLPYEEVPLNAPLSVSINDHHGIVRLAPPLPPPAREDYEDMRAQEPVNPFIGRTRFVSGSSNSGNETTPATLRHTPYSNVDLPN